MYTYVFTHYFLSKLIASLDSLTIYLPNCLLKHRIWNCVISASTVLGFPWENEIQIGSFIPKGEFNFVCVFVYTGSTDRVCAVI